MSGKIPASSLGRADNAKMRSASRDHTAMSERFHSVRDFPSGEIRTYSATPAFVALIDECRLTLECLALSFRYTASSIKLATFVAVEDFVAADIAAVDAVIYIVHPKSNPDQSVKDATLFRAHHEAKPIVMIADTAAASFGAIHEILATSICAFLPLQTTGFGTILTALNMALFSQRMDIPVSIDDVDQSVSNENRLALTGRQREVLALLAEGKQNKLIAFALNLRESTVKSHVAVILQRLGAHNRTEAVYLARAALAQ